MKTVHIHLREKEEVYENTNIALNKGTNLDITWQEFITANNLDKPRMITKLCNFVMKQQDKTFGHIIRAPATDLMRRPAISRYLTQIEQLYKRTGHPRMKWVGENCKYAYNGFYNTKYNQANEEHLNNLTQLATNRHL